LQELARFVHNVEVEKSVLVMSCWTWLKK